MSAMVQFNPAGMPAHLVDLFGDGGNDDLISGAEAAFPVLSIKGKVWRVSHGGEQRVLQRDGEPIQSIDVVIVAANRLLSKLYYAKAYQEGDDNPPDCSSANGLTPDAGVPNPQAASCATCAHNAWGSKISEQGKKTKACGDTRRAALIPERDMECKTWGAPLLLRIPPGTFQALTEYARTQLGGKKYCAVVTRIGFDMMVAYPKITFKPLRFVTEAEAIVIDRWRNDPIVGRITGTDADPSAPNTRNVIPIHPVAPPSVQVPLPVVAPAPVTAASPPAADPFSRAAPVAPAPAPLPAQSPPADPLAGVPDSLKAAIAMVGGPATAAGKAILATLTPAPAPASPAKRTRRSKAEMEAANAAAALVAMPDRVSAIQGDLVPRAAAPCDAPAVAALTQGVQEIREAEHLTDLGFAAPLPPRQPAPVAMAPSGQEDLLAGVDALLAGLDNMGFDD